ncbi:MAG: hypothetical protein AB8H86_10135 [Polyangiales bacterium]
MRIYWGLLAALLACSSSTSPTGDAADVGMDAAVDSASFDAGVDSGVDAGVDAPAEDAGNDAGPPLSACVIEYFDNQGDGCFCMGPVATFENYVYRQSLGIEVYDAQDPSSLIRLRNVDERPSANGHLAVRGDVLISSLDFEEQPLRLYSLADPALPTEILRFGAVSVRSFAAGESDVVVIEATRERASALVHYAINDEGATETWRVPLPDVPAFPDASLALVGTDVFLATLEERDPERTRVRRYDASGAETLNVMRRGYGSLYASDGELYETNGEARVARLDPATLDTEMSFGEARFGETVLVRGDIVLLSGTIALERQTFRELSLSVVGTDGPRGFDVLEAGEGEVVFGSNGNGLIPFSLRCE